MAQQSNKQTRAEKRDAARAEVKRLREEQARRDKRNRMLTILGVVAVLAAAAVVVVVILMDANKPAEPAAEEVTGKPAGITANNGFPFGSDLTAGTSNEGAVTVEMWSDYMCPGCGSWEQTFGGTLEELTKNGEITLVLHPLANLDRYSAGTEYSTRGTNAAAIIGNYEPDKLLKFHELMYVDQPEENSEGRTDEQIAEIATQAGVSEETVAKLTSGEFAEWVKAETEDAFNVDKVQSTPWMTINGKRWTPDDSETDLVEQLKTAIEDAK